MSFIAELPVELLLKIFRFAVQLDHPRSLEEPLIDWSWNRILFERSLRVYKESLSTKVSLALVSQQWHEIVTPLLYEHVTIDSLSKLQSIIRLFTFRNATNLPSLPNGRSPSPPPLGDHVQRIDLILGVTYTGLEWGQPRALGPAHLDVPIMQLFTSVPNLRVLTMLLAEGIDDRDVVLKAIPPKLEKFYWKHAGGPSSISPSRVLRFFDGHPHLTHLSLPSHPWSEDPSERVWPHDFSRKPRPSIREFFLQDHHQALSISFLSSRGLLPGLASRSTLYPTTADPNDIHADLAAVVSAHVTEQPGKGVVVDRSTPNPTITSLTIVEYFSEDWPTQGLTDRLRIVKKLCPNLEDIHFIIKGKTDFSLVPPKPSGIALARIPLVTTISFQRMVTQGIMRDAIGTLRNTLTLPWKDSFPSLTAIRIMEDLDFDEVKAELLRHHDRGVNWGVRIEDRFGDALIG
ncbi:hypothetical protein FA13DRAFT_1736632 [Coprinellus micaceus]|uniref:Uncharacterized protein n=1 Tax=Coprinellus micaceus TaxID=71717 RepID=A0A4Y7SZF4_COPMI|nr:hypothetical protein FA13DRAFT_1736632 [Coprinellus micaceus]